MLQVGIERLAKRYALALFQLAQEYNKIDAIYQQLKAVAELTTQVRELQFLFKTPFIEPLEKAKIIEKIFTGKVDELLLKFILLLVRKNRVLYIDAIFKQYEKVFFKHKGIKDVDLVVPIELDKQTINFIAQKVKEIFKVNDAILRQQVDNSIIGGVIIRVEEGQIDLSIRKKLQKARHITEKIISEKITSQNK